MVVVDKLVILINLFCLDVFMNLNKGYVFACWRVLLIIYRDVLETLEFGFVRFVDLFYEFLCLELMFMCFY